MLRNGHKVRAGSIYTTPPRVYRDGNNRPILFSDQLNDQSSLARAVIEIDVNDLLPGAQGELPVNKWDRERGTQQGGADMAVAVAIMPARVVGILAVGRNDLIKEPSQVTHGTAFILNRRQCAGGGRAEKGGSSVFESTVRDKAGNPICNVMDVGIPTGGERKGEGFNGHLNQKAFEVFVARLQAESRTRLPEPESTIWAGIACPLPSP